MGEIRGQRLVDAQQAGHVALGRFQQRVGQHVALNLFSDAIDLIRRDDVFDVAVPFVLEVAAEIGDLAGASTGLAAHGCICDQGRALHSFPQAGLGRAGS